MLQSGHACELDAAIIEWHGSKMAGMDSRLPPNFEADVELRLARCGVTVYSADGTNPNGLDAFELRHVGGSQTPVADNHEHGKPLDAAEPKRSFETHPNSKPLATGDIVRCTSKACASVVNRRTPRPAWEQELQYSCNERLAADGALDGFRAAADQARRATAGCAVVVYTCAFGRSAEDVPILFSKPPPADAIGCAVAFVDSYASGATRAAANVSGWQLLPVEPTMPWASPRFNSRLVKLRPELFFDVSPTIYIDAKKAFRSELEPAGALVALLDTTLLRCGAAFAAFAHPWRPSSVLAELDAITEVAVVRPNITGDLLAIARLRATYAADATFAAADAAGRTRMIDGSFILRNATGRSEVAIAARHFGCAWLQEFLASGADRDQPPFAFAYAKMEGAPGVRCGDSFMHLMRTSPDSRGPDWASAPPIDGASWPHYGSKG